MKHKILPVSYTHLQIKEKAIRRLRQSNRSKLLKSYLG